jgi:hypothetical protein
MAIQPIDLQALFTQVEKVGKAQSAQREGLALQQDIQGAQIQRKTEEQVQSVNQTQNMGDGAEKVKDEKRQRQDSRGGKKKDAEQKDGDLEKAQTIVFHDPRLGKNIDISL